MQMLECFIQNNVGSPITVLLPPRLIPYCNSMSTNRDMSLALGFVNVIELKQLLL